MDINTLRAMRTNDFSKISSAFESDTNGGKSYEDNRFWKLERDKAGNANAVIRFLPRVEGDELPWVKVFSHGFKGPTGKWYIENSLTTVGKQDPVGELNTTLWNSGSDANKEIALSQKRRLNYISNVLVVSDPAHPENNGKVVLFKYGKKIFDKLNEAMNPQFADEEAVNPFDLWSGANFKLKIRQVEGYRNYDKSEFDKPKALLDDDEELEKIWKTEHSLKEFLDPKNFKSYDELHAKLMKVLDENTAPSRTRAAEEDIPWGNDEVEAPKPRAAAAPKYAAVDDEEEDESLQFFKKLAAK